MGSIVNGQCVESAATSVSIWCSHGFPKVVGGSSSVPVVQFCAATFDGGGAVLTTADFEGLGSGEWSYTDGSYTATADWGTGACAAFELWFEGFGSPRVVNDCAESAGTFTANTDGPFGPVTWTGSRAVVGGTVGTSTTVPLTFPTCDYAESYADSGILFTGSLLALVLVWGAKNFIYKLVTNQ